MTDTTFATLPTKVCPTCKSGIRATRHYIATAGDDAEEATATICRDPWHSPRRCGRVMYDLPPGMRFVISGWIIETKRRTEARCRRGKDHGGPCVTETVGFEVLGRGDHRTDLTGPRT